MASTTDEEFLLTEARHAEKWLRESDSALAGAMASLIGDLADLIVTLRQRLDDRDSVEEDEARYGPEG